MEYDLVVESYFLLRTKYYQRGETRLFTYH